jgi:phosphoglycolate phosphatase-like HAD superfamily hydrolase
MSSHTFRTQRHLFYPPVAFPACVSRQRCRSVTCRVRNVDAPQALLFDCDGVLVDTEKDGHRVAFNAAFNQLGLPHEWDVETYGRLLSIGGGKERMTAYFNEHADAEPFKSITNLEEQQEFIKKVHKLKTGLFQAMIEEGVMPLRPGVASLVGTRLLPSPLVAATIVASFETELF